MKTKGGYDPKVGESVIYNGKSTLITKVSGSDITLSNGQTVKKYELTSSPAIPDSVMSAGKKRPKFDEPYFTAIAASMLFDESEKEPIETEEYTQEINGGKTKRKSNTRKKPRSLKKRIR